MERARAQQDALEKYRSGELELGRGRLADSQKYHEGALSSRNAVETEKRAQQELFAKTYQEAVAQNDPHPYQTALIKANGLISATTVGALAPKSLRPMALGFVDQQDVKDLVKKRTDADKWLQENPPSSGLFGLGDNSSDIADHQKQINEINRKLDEYRMKSSVAPPAPAAQPKRLVWDADKGMLVPKQQTSGALLSGYPEDTSQDGSDSADAYDPFAPNE
jgi:hypothetical protein